MSTAARIKVQLAFNYGGSSFSGKSSDGQVASIVQGDSLQVFIAKDGISESRPPLELVNLITKHCGITNRVHCDLIHAVLNEKNLARLKEEFRQEGIHIPDSVLDGMFGLVSFRFFGYV